MGGKLKDINSIELGQTAAKAAIEAAKISPEQIDSVVVGNVMQHTHKNGTFIARHVGLGAGIRLETPCLSVNRLCGSGFEAVVNASHVRFAIFSSSKQKQNFDNKPFFCFAFRISSTRAPK